MLVEIPSLKLVDAHAAIRRLDVYRPRRRWQRLHGACIRSLVAGLTLDGTKVSDRAGIAGEIQNADEADHKNGGKSRSRSRHERTLYECSTLRAVMSTVPISSSMTVSGGVTQRVSTFARQPRWHSPMIPADLGICRTAFCA